MSVRCALCRVVSFCPYDQSFKLQVALVKGDLFLIILFVFCCFCFSCCYNLSDDRAPLFAYFYFPKLVLAKSVGARSHIRTLIMTLTLIFKNGLSTK